MGIIYIFILILLASAFEPRYVVILLVLNLIVGLFLSAFQIVIALIPNSKPKRRPLEREPFVSIFIPSYNEPPAILIQTIDALSRLDYRNYEVLVIDNNTRSEKVWKPVEAYMETKNKKFHFFHVGHLSGFKAGALNYLMDEMNEKAEHIAVIDADYLVEPDFLKVAMPYFSEDRIALVQFPQKYRNRTKGNQPIADEYRHFFEIYMNMANNLDCVPSTGTVSVYNLAALKSVGGFRGDALTEDADVGLRLYGAGYRGVYVEHQVGFGLMPYDLESYRKQKWRWAFGNAQSLKKLFLLFGKMPFKSWIGFLSHLTAWHHFHFLPFAALAAFPVLLHPDIPITDYHRQILFFASLSILATIAAKMVLFLVTMRKQNDFFGRAVRAFVVHMGLTMVYSEALVSFIFREKFAFARTNKFILRKVPSLVKNTYVEFLLGTWFLMGAILALYWERPIVIVAFLISAGALFSIYYVDRKLAPTKEFSKKILEKAEEEYEKYLPAK